MLFKQPLRSAFVLLCLLAFVEARGQTDSVTDKLDSRNFYAFNPSFDKPGMKKK